MMKTKIISTCLVLLGLSFSHTSYADCPNILQFETQTDGSFIASTEQGIWKQFTNEQSYISSNEELNPQLSFYFALGKDAIYIDESTVFYDNMVCIYRTKNNKFVFLKSPKNKKHVIIFPNLEKSPSKWSAIDKSSFICGSEEWLNSSNDLINDCNFFSL